MSGVIRLSLCALLFASACDLSHDQAYDDKDQNLDYIVATVLRPMCGTTECHSTEKQQSDDVFDSVEQAKKSFNRHTELVVRCEDLMPTPQVSPCTEAAQNSYLYTVTEMGVSSGDGIGDIMPLDQPIGNAQQDLLIDWINNGALGYTPDPTDI
ncbi:MAG: hypothetical protein QM831_19270 [Kofleriaceae bacterium]